MLKRVYSTQICKSINHVLFIVFRVAVLALVSSICPIRLLHCMLYCEKLCVNEREKLPWESKYVKASLNEISCITISARAIYLNHHSRLSVWIIMWLVFNVLVLLNVFVVICLYANMSFHSIRSILSWSLDNVCLYVYHFRNDNHMCNTYWPLYLRMSKMSSHATNCLTCLMSKYQHVLTLLNMHS